MQRILSPKHEYQELDQYLLKFRRVFLVCSSSFQRLTVGVHLEKLADKNSIQLVRFSGFSPNPGWEEVQEGIAHFRASACELIAAVGGGSAIDAAKCIRCSVGGNIPLLAVPTTAGSGSEATHFAVVYRNSIKESVNCGLPDTVLLDPSALDTLPLYQRKATMLDALCHGIESFWSLKATQESKEYSTQALQQIMHSYQGYLDNTPEGNAGMLNGAHLAGKAINIAQTTAGHAMCYQITKLYGLAHGHAAALCVAKLWPFVLKQCDNALRPVLETLSQAAGGHNAEEGAEQFQTILDGLELRCPACTQNELETLTASVNPERLKNFPVPLTEGEIRGLYQKILRGNAA